MIGSIFNASDVSIPQFRGFGMIILHYEIRICQKCHNTVTITVYVWTVVQILMKQTLGILSRKYILTSIT